MIEIQSVSKRYGEKLAVDELSFVVRPGIVTGFLGPNGAGKSTTMRMIVGLDAPTSGRTVVNGRQYREHVAPLTEVGALLEAKAIHQGRSARNHLLSLAHTNGLGSRRVDEVLEMVGLAEVAKKRAGAFSLGMGQRLGIASALLGDPQTVVLDEPVNGLDPEGIRWIRDLMLRLAREGRTVLVSSHLMSEMAVTAEHLIVIGRGRLIADTSMEAFLASASGDVVRVRSPEASRLVDVLAGDGVTLTSIERGVLDVAGLSPETIGDRALDAGVALHELSRHTASLEEAFMELTRDDVEYRATNERELEGVPA